MRRPEDALPVLESAHKNDPDNVDVRLLMAYAWLELERYDRAMPIFEELAATQPAWPRRVGAKHGYANWDRFSSDLNLSLAHAYGNDTPRAEQALFALEDVGPYNEGLQSAIGSVQSMRMRPSAALERYDMALTLEPRLRDAREGRTRAFLALHRPDLALAEYERIRSEYPAREPSLDQLGREVRRYRGWQFEANAARARSEPRRNGTSASPFGGRDGGYDLKLRTPLLGERWRIGFIASDDWADFDDGLGNERVDYRRLGAGIEYRYDRLGVAAYGWRTNDSDSRSDTGFAVGADWRFSDAWTGRVGYAHNSPDASLQARRFDILADSFSVGAIWQPSDHTWLDLRASRFRYDDGNRRDYLGASFAQRLWSRPHWSVTGLADAATSRGSRGDQVPYFNPSRDAAFNVGARVDHITWRRYERAFHQRFEVRVGPYWQEGYGTAWVPSASYRHIWNLTTGSRLEYGVSWSRPVYDGNREERIGFDVSYKWGTAP